jgi:penicillin-binding protein 2
VSPKHLTYITILLLLLVLARLIYLQLQKGPELTLKALTNVYSSQFGSAPRGLILDWRDNILVEDEKTYCLDIPIKFSKRKKEVESQVNRAISSLTKVLPVEESELSWNEKSLTLSVCDLSHEKLVKAFRERDNLPTFFISERYRRKNNYPFEFAHVVGYLGSPSAEEKRQLAQLGFNPQELIGKAGLERSFDLLLRGYPQVYKVIYNAKRQVLSKQPIRQVIKGSNVKLALDLNWQKLAFNLLGNRAGSIIVFDLDTNEVRVLVSKPSFDPNAFNLSNHEKIRSFLESPDKPLLFRATQGMYPPGSVVKMFSAILASSQINVSQFTEYCNGGKFVGGKFLKCHKHEGHGKTNLSKAIRESCDTFFYSLAQRFSYSDFFQGYKSLGLMEKLEFPLPVNRGLIVPPEKVRNSLFESALISIGQGNFSISPFQLGVLINGLATDGKIFRPILVKEISDQMGQITFKAKPQILWSFDFPKPLKEEIWKGLIEAVNHPAGTAYKAGFPDGLVAGKTGTAQVVELKKHVKGSHLDHHAWFVGFWPIKPKPRYSIVVQIEHGGSGGKVAAPLAAEFIRLVNGI